MRGYKLGPDGKPVTYRSTVNGARYVVPWGSPAHLFLLRLFGDGGDTHLIWVRVYDLSGADVSRIPAGCREYLAPYRKAKDWYHPGFGPGDLEAIEVRPVYRRSWDEQKGRNRKVLDRYEVGGTYTVCTPYGEHTVEIKTETADVPADGKEPDVDKLAEMVREAIDWYLDEHREEWEDADDEDESEEWEGKDPDA